MFPTLVSKLEKHKYITIILIFFICWICPAENVIKVQTRQQHVETIYNKSVHKGVCCHQVCLKYSATRTGDSVCAQIARAWLSPKQTAPPGVAGVVGANESRIKWANVCHRPVPNVRYEIGKPPTPEQ